MSSLPWGWLWRCESRVAQTSTLTVTKCREQTYVRLRKSGHLLFDSMFKTRSYDARKESRVKPIAISVRSLSNRTHQKRRDCNEWSTGWGISRLTPLYPTNGLSYATGSQYIVVGGKAARNAWHGCHGRHLEGRHLGSNFVILNGKGGMWYVI